MNKENIIALLSFYAITSTILGGHTIYRMSAIIADKTAQQPVITEECMNGHLYNVQNFDGLKVYDDAYIGCGK